MDFCEGYAGLLVLAAVAAACVAESGEHHLVRAARTGGVIWRAKRDAVLGLPKMWHKRQHIQKTRVASIGEVWRQLDKRTITTKFGRREI